MVKKKETTKKKSKSKKKSTPKKTKVKGALSPKKPKKKLKQKKDNALGGTVC